MAVPDRGRLLECARALVPVLRARAAAVERARRVPAEGVAELRAAGLFRVVQPRRFGGYELDFDLVVELVMELARGCASTAWVYGLGAAHQWLVACYPLETQHEVWDGNGDALACGSYAPAGTVSAAPGGYRLSGSWAFASGCDNMEWAALGAAMPVPGGDAPPQPGFLLVPAADYVIEDNWHTAGLAGTGSKTLVLEDVFVPARRAVSFARMMACRAPDAVIHAHPMYRLPMLSGIASCLAATAVGAGKGALEQYVERTRAHVTRGAIAGSESRMAEFATVQLRVAEAMASLDAAETILLRDVRAAIERLRRGGELTVEDRIRSRRGQSFAVRLAIAAVEALNASTGGGGLFLDNPVQRAWRDANAVGRHISMNWDAVGTMVGQHALGLTPRGQY